MDDRDEHRGRHRRSLSSSLAVGAFVLAAGGSGMACGGDDSGGAQPGVDAGQEASNTVDANTPPDANTPGDAGTDSNDNGTIGSIKPSANGTFQNPTDSTPDPTGASIYFTAQDLTGNPGVFSVNVATNAVTPLFVDSTGSAFVSPFGIAISEDGKTLFVADLAASEDPTDVTKDSGVIYSLDPAGGAAPVPLVGSVKPHSLEVVDGTLYFTGIDKANGVAGVFSIPVGGGAVTTIAEGAPFADPSGVTADAKGNVYVVDTIAGPSQNAILVKIANNTASQLGSDFFVNYPAGIALSGDGTEILVSSILLGAGDAVMKFDVSTGNATPFTTGISTNSEAAGLHRAHAAPVYSWADTKATPPGMSGTGTVYVIK